MSLIFEHLASTHHRNDAGTPHIMTDDPAVNSLTPLLMKSYLFVDTDTAQHCTCSSNVKLFEPL